MINIKKIFLNNKKNKNNYKFFQNKNCKYFPCHQIKDKKIFNCIFCYCPLYHIFECNGAYKILKNNKKDCSKCLYPHIKNNYINIIEKLKSIKN